MAGELKFSYITQDVGKKKESSCKARRQLLPVAQLRYTTVHLDSQRQVVSGLFTLQNTDQKSFTHLLQKLKCRICEDHCRGNGDCGAGQLCIRRGCRQICTPAQGPVVGICVDRCRGDQDCGVGRLCVSNGCGHVCRPAQDQDGSRPGSCPRLPPGTVGHCAELCRGDWSCPSGQKCCSNGCGHTCKNAVQDTLQTHKAEKSI
ncbi:hypothetical protein HPG69_003134 [Diceros bicornis minor]|uniref:WAP domain-containing protein n=1 Tax=Diceros bicornis minor TaxID=77932 RepID=A0A7J7EJS8_DICBM|nr:hypothetical protein HPG69_003134 [Diceros bicornis minor]